MYIIILYVHSHENISGFYRVSVFFLAKVVTDLIPMRIIPLCLFSVIAYFMVGKLNVIKDTIIMITVLFVVS